MTQKKLRILTLLRSDFGHFHVVTFISVKRKEAENSPQSTALSKLVLEFMQMINQTCRIMYLFMKVIVKKVN